MSKRNKRRKNDSTVNEKFPLPVYKRADDIYNHEKEVPLKDEEQLEKAMIDRNAGDGLDIPGSELDDVNENIGEEDEENNYYSLGGDNHENLEEDNS